LIDDVLSLSKIEADKLTLYETYFDLHRLLRDVEGILEPKAAAKQLQLAIARAPDLVQYIRSDEGKLRQLLINVLGNAVKFTATGRVTLRASSAPPEPSGEIALAIDIEDTGPGIDPEERDRLFQAFEQGNAGRNAAEGTGLGLAISRRFARLMGGDLTMSSEVGVGSTFHIRVLAQAAQASDLATRAGASALPVALAPGHPTYRIAVVEDKAANRELLLKLLEPLGFEVRCAVNGREGVELWRQWQPHLVWMDMRMPVMDGYEATRRIKDFPQGDRTVVISLTASTLAEDREAVLAAGCDDFVRKPIRAETLYAKLTEHLGVEFSYAAETDASVHAHPQEERNLSWQDCRDRVEQLPGDWVAELYYAAESLDEERVCQLLDRLPAERSELKVTLATLAQSVRFDRIMQLSQWAVA
ncbi:MAG: ATP-binding protein, partial [Cyanobacteria bacterium J06648_11]